MTDKSRIECRPIEFIGIQDDNTWQTFIEQVPAQIGWDEMQAFADGLMTNTPYSRFIKIFPWNEEPDEG